MKNKAKYMTDETGFTLMEVLIAMAIFGVALLGLAQLQIASIQGNRFSYDVTGASAIASDEMEHLVSMRASDAAGVRCPAPEQIRRSGLTYTRTCEMTGIEIGQRTAVIQVQWTGKNGMNRSVVMSSLL